MNDLDFLMNMEELEWKGQPALKVIMRYAFISTRDNTSELE